MGRFNSRTPFTDSPTGFYGILNDTFAQLAKEEDAACDWEGFEPVDYPEFGHSKDGFEDGVKAFYRVWINFSTKKSFSWRDEYRASDAPDRQTRRLVEKENKRLRDEGIREFNDAVRSLVTFVRKRDPRFTPNTQSEEDRQKVIRDAATAQAARNRAANKAKLDSHVLPTWAQPEKADDLEGSFSSEEEEIIEEIECVVCDKVFKSEKQYEAHEKSKKHIKAVQQLQRQMRAENKDFDLDVALASEQFDDLTVAVEDEEGDAYSDFHSEKAEITQEKETNGHRSPKFDVEVILDRNIPSQPTNPTLDFVPSTALPLEDSDIDGEYAPRKEVESRLANALETTGISTPESESGDTGPKLGKAKAKRAKKLARQEQVSQEDQEVSEVQSSVH